MATEQNKSPPTTHTKTYGVRRFTTYRDDRRCFELYETATGKCASFPCTKKDGEKAAKRLNAEARGQQ